MSDLNNLEIYAGFAGIDLPVDELDLGQGIVIRKTYAHVMAPYLAAFKHPELGKPHPPPWKAISGGLAFDIEAELHIPLSFYPEGWFDRLNTVWWFLALFRYKATALTTVPVITNVPFTEIPEMEDEPFFWSVEMSNYRLIPDANPTKLVALSDLEWIKDYWLSAGFLMNGNKDFNFAFQAIDRCMSSQNSALALVLLWGALERLFLRTNQELRFRVSTAIASYLEPPGKGRHDLYKSVRKLYDERSKAAHGSDGENHEAFLSTYTLLKRVLEKVIEENHVPSQAQLEALIFGVT